MYQHRLRQPCEDTISSIESLHDSIVNACLEAGNVAIPRRITRHRASPLFGWNELVAVQRERDIFWHLIRKQCDSPINGVVA